jgi:hypothetical protein
MSVGWLASLRTAALWDHLWDLRAAVVAVEKRECNWAAALELLSAGSWVAMRDEDEAVLMVADLVAIAAESMAWRRVAR